MPPTLVPAWPVGDAAGMDERPETDRAPTGDQPGSDRSAVTVAEAAVLLGLSTDAIRSRLNRGTLDGRKDAGGWVVLLPRPAATVDQPSPTGQQPSATWHRPRPDRGQGRDDRRPALRGRAPAGRARDADRRAATPRRAAARGPRPDPRPRRRPGRPIVTSGGTTTGHAPGPGAPVAPAVVAVLGSVTLDDAAIAAATPSASPRCRARACAAAPRWTPTGGRRAGRSSTRTPATTGGGSWTSSAGRAGCDRGCDVDRPRTWRRPAWLRRASLGRPGEKEKRWGGVGAPAPVRSVPEVWRRGRGAPSTNGYRGRPDRADN